jgi:hypothetical protein
MFLGSLCEAWFLVRGLNSSKIRHGAGGLMLFGRYPRSFTWQPGWESDGSMKYLLGALLISGTAHAADQLPSSMLGKWASDAAACGQQSSELGMTVEPRTVLFYEHGYQIKRITRLKDGSLKGTGYGFADDGRSNDSITLKLIDPNKLQARGEIYYRCERQSGGTR